MPDGSSASTETSTVRRADDFIHHVEDRQAEAEHLLPGTRARHRGRLAARVGSARPRPAESAARLTANGSCARLLPPKRRTQRSPIAADGVRGDDLPVLVGDDDGGVLALCVRTISSAYHSTFFESSVSMACAGKIQAGRRRRIGVGVVQPAW